MLGREKEKRKKKKMSGRSREGQRSTGMNGKLISIRQLNFWGTLNQSLLFTKATKKVRHEGLDGRRRRRREEGLKKNEGKKKKKEKLI